MRGLSVILFAIVLPIALWLGVAMLQYVSSLPDWLGLALIFNLLVIIAFGIHSAIKRRWNYALLSLLPLVLFAFAKRFETEITPPISAIGFRALALSDSGYLSKCRTIGFDESGKRQQFGICNVIPLVGTATFIVYDTSGEVIAPVHQRSKAWIDAASSFTATNFLAGTDEARSRIVGDFYRVVLRRPDEM